MLPLGRKLLLKASCPHRGCWDDLAHLLRPRSLGWFCPLMLLFPSFEKLTGDYLQISAKVFFHRLSLDVSFRFLKIRCHPFTDFFVSAIPTIFEHLLYVRHLFPPGTEDITAIKIGKISASKAELHVV